MNHLLFRSSVGLGTEFSAILKNIFAIGAGLLKDIGYRENSYAFLLSLSLN